MSVFFFDDASAVQIWFYLYADLKKKKTLSSCGWLMVEDQGILLYCSKTALTQTRLIGVKLLKFKPEKTSKRTSDQESCVHFFISSWESREKRLPSVSNQIYYSGGYSEDLWEKGGHLHKKCRYVIP